MPANAKIPFLTIIFHNRLKTSEIPAFRGAVISKVPAALTLFHNHLADSFRFSYPLIQYKTIGSKAAIVCLGEGVEEIERFFSNEDLTLTLGKREELFSVECVQAGQWEIQPGPDFFYYQTRKWLPFNKDNYHKYLASESLSEKAGAMERILTGHILSMGKGLNHFFQEPVQASILQINHSKTYPFKGVRLQGFDITWKSNLYLPDYLGLGKGSSIGFGITEKDESRTKPDGA